ncbi:cupin domain-containing protein [Humisphaera borealis]|uniref:Cupin domain-containing protein n=2 Tax=Humisphaera borealis TaxID=2807512 RepID=A0A7M2X4A9_9BACT|nr:cupin domain-containing protein [Humisphaera borealis]
MKDTTRALVVPDLLRLIDDPALPWQAFVPGIEIFRLYRLETGQSAALLRYTPGARLIRHRHVGMEHILVLRGSQADENGVHRQGTLLIHPPGTAHSVRSDEGCVALAIWERPVVFDPPAGTSVERL